MYDEPSQPGHACVSTSIQSPPPPPSKQPTHLGRPLPVRARDGHRRALYALEAPDVVELELRQRLARRQLVGGAERRCVKVCCVFGFGWVRVRDWLEDRCHRVDAGFRRAVQRLSPRNHLPSMTPPVAPKRTAAPVLCPRGSSGGMPCTILGVRAHVVLGDGGEGEATAGSSLIDPRTCHCALEPNKQNVP